MKKAFITTLGCKVNQFESASFKSDFQKEGLGLTEDIEQADIIVINTCAVTNKASAHSRREIRRAARINQNAKIVVTGCHAHLAADELKLIDDISPERLTIIGNDQKEALVSHCLIQEHTGPAISGKTRDPSADISRLKVDTFENRTRAYLRVQDGCNSFCSYCIVPYTRGRSRSLPLAEVVHQAHQYAAVGHQEIIVTGIHVGQYGKDLKELVDIAQLMATVCKELPHIRFRLSSIEPLEISQTLLSHMSSITNFMPHLHIPLQSGDNDILERMNRRYTREQFQEIVNTCRATLPDAAIGIDVLVGFPGENNDHFSNTQLLLEKIDCTYLHVFPYSSRPGTKAADFKDQLTKDIKRIRVEELRSLGEKKRTRFYNRNLGTRRYALLEKERDTEGNLKGFTDNYIPVLVKGDDSLMNCITLVQLDKLMQEAVTACTV